MAQASDNPRVSAIVTTYNRAAMLPRAVRSVLAQTYEDYELIIVDDCSTDDTPEVIRTFADPRIRAVRQADNAGVSAARNTGIRLARGEYVALLDDDDEWLPRKLQRQVAALDASDPGVGLAYTWLDVVDAAGTRHGDRRSVVSGDIFSAMVDLQVPAPPSTYMVRAEAARDVGGFDEAIGMGDDVDFLLRLSMRWRVAVVRDVLVLMHSEGHARSEQWAGAADDWAAYFWAHVRRFDGELRERPRTFARLLRLLAITEIRRGNLRGAAAAYSKALTVDAADTLRATVANVEFVAGLLWGRVRPRRG